MFIVAKRSPILATAEHLLCLFRFSILCVFCLSLDYFVPVSFGFIVLVSVSSVLYATRLAIENVSDMTYFVSAGRKTLTPSISWSWERRKRLVLIWLRMDAVHRGFPRYFFAAGHANRPAVYGAVCIFVRRSGIGRFFPATICLPVNKRRN